MGVKISIRFLLSRAPFSALPASIHITMPLSAWCTLTDQAMELRMHNWISTQCSVLLKTIKKIQPIFHMTDFLQYSKYVSTCCDSIRSHELSSVLSVFFHPQNSKIQEIINTATLAFTAERLQRTFPFKYVFAGKLPF